MMQIIKKSRVFLMAAVLILQFFLLPLAEVGRASASEVSDQLVSSCKGRQSLLVKIRMSP